MLITGIIAKPGIYKDIKYTANELKKIVEIWKKPLLGKEYRTEILVQYESLIIGNILDIEYSDTLKGILVKAEINPIGTNGIRGLGSSFAIKRMKNKTAKDIELVNVLVTDNPFHGFSVLKGINNG